MSVNFRVSRDGKFSSEVVVHTKVVPVKTLAGEPVRAKGSIFFNSTNNKLHFSTGTGWVQSVSQDANGLVTIPNALLGASAGGSVIRQGYTVDTAGGVQVITAQELVSGYAYLGASGGAVALTLPGADAVQTLLAADGITTVAGMQLPPIIINNTTIANLTVTAGTGETVVGGLVFINNSTAVVHYVFTAANTATAVVIASN